MAGSLVLRYAARSHVGKVRAKNDDSAYAGQYLAVVADGMGGHAGGDVASASTVLELVHLDHGNYEGDVGTQLADEIQTANSLLSEMVSVNPKLTGMGTTVTALLLAEGKLQFAHIGDSRAYRLKNDVFEQMSTDHTFVQRLIDEGRVTPEEAESHPHKNVLMRVLGDVDASPELDLTSFEVDPGERWLLCSDGLNFVPVKVVEEVLRNTISLAETADRLIELTLEAGSPDNVTVVVIEVAEASQDDIRTDQLHTITPADATPDAAPVTVAGDEMSAPEERQNLEHKSDGLTNQPIPTRKTRTNPGTKTAENAEQREPGGNRTAATIKKELMGRPHELVGAAVTASTEGKIPVVSGRPKMRRAATVLTHKPEPAEPGEEYLLTEPPRRRPWFSVVAAAVLVILLAAGAWFGYAWTQTRYYVGESNGKVAIFNGISQTLGPIKLSHIYKETPITVESLPEFSQQRLRQTLPAATLRDADQIVEELRLGIVSPPDGPSHSNSPSPSPSNTPSPNRIGPPSPSPTPSPREPSQARVVTSAAGAALGTGGTS